MGKRSIKENKNIYQTSRELWIENSIVDGKLNKSSWEHITKDSKGCPKQG